MAYTEESYLNEALQLTQEQAELNRYRVGIWSQDQYEAFMLVWSNGKAYLSEALAWLANGPSCDEVARLADLLRSRLAVTS